VLRKRPAGWLLCKASQFAKLITGQGKDTGAAMISTFSEALPVHLRADLGRWEKTGPLFTGQPQCAAALRPPG
jgi:hypothetical protein